MVSQKQEALMSREKILARIKRHQPAETALPSLDIASISRGDSVERFKTILVRIGGSVIEVRSKSEIEAYLHQNFASIGRWVSLVEGVGERGAPFDDPHTLENVVLAVVRGEFGVAENGAIWITDAMMGDRALPFITQNLAVVIKREGIVSTLHEAYEKIGNASYAYGTFIAGPSKTADIEQSLVLGAHGPKSHVVFLLSE
jgi:L-lactate dehydrogenase complex protein LldG